MSCFFVVVVFRSVHEAGDFGRRRSLDFCLRSQHTQLHIAGCVWYGVSVDTTNRGHRLQFLHTKKTLLTPDYRFSKPFLRLLLYIQLVIYNFFFFTICPQRQTKQFCKTSDYCEEREELDLCWMSRCHW